MKIRKRDGHVQLSPPVSMPTARAPCLSWHHPAVMALHRFRIYESPLCEFNHSLLTLAEAPVCYRQWALCLRLLYANMHRRQRRVFPYPTRRSLSTTSSSTKKDAFRVTRVRRRPSPSRTMPRRWPSRTTVRCARVRKHAIINEAAIKYLKRIVTTQC